MNRINNRREFLISSAAAAVGLGCFSVGSKDFDQMISVRVTGQKFSDAELSRGIAVTFPGRANTSMGRIQEKGHASGTLVGGSDPKPIQVDALREFYFEEGELSVPPKFRSTAEEKRSGFSD